MGKLKGAIVGFGQVAEKAHVPAFKADSRFEIVAVVENLAERKALGEATFHNVRSYSSLEALFAQEPSLDFVDIATPPFLHARQALLALRRGCHVLCEKPLTLQPGEFAELESRASEAGRALFTVHNWAHSPQWLKIFELARSGVLGVLRRASLEVLRTKPAASAMPGDWRRQASLAGGGILVDHGWHNLYLIHRLLGSAISRVSVERFEAPGPGEAEDEVAVRLDLASRAQAFLRLSWRAQVRSNSAEIAGDRGTLRLDEAGLSLSAAGRPSETFAFPQKLSQGSAHPEWFASMLQDFQEAVENPPSRARNLEEARFCVEAISQAYKAARVGSPSSS